MNKVGGYGLQIHSDTNNFVMFIGFLCKTGGPRTIENWVKKIYNPATKTKRWVMIEKLMTMLVGILLALAGWSLSRTFELSTIQAVHEDKVQKLERQLEKMEDKMDKMMDSDEEIMDQHEQLFKKLQEGNTSGGYSYN